jgi:diguanylate cyclase (GGDEF)-like protein/PAS domain S-box-containing protein
VTHHLAHSSLLAAGIEALDSGITVFDAELRLVAVNQRFFQLIGIPPAVARVGASIEALFRYNAEHGEYGVGLIEDQVAQRVATAREFAPHCFERERPDGRIVEVRGCPLPDGGGFVTIYTDITVQRRREQALERLRAELEQRVAERTAELRHKTTQLEQVVSHIRQGITLFNQDLKMELCNPQFLDIMRFPPDFGQPGRPFADFIRYNAERGEYGPGNVDEQVQARVTQARHFTAHQFERSRPDGTAVEVIGAPTSDGGFVTTYLDVTERKRTQKHLQTSEQRFRDFAHAATDWFFETDAQLRYSWFSNRLQQVTGVSAPTPLGKRREEFASAECIAQEPEKWAQHLAQMQAREAYRDFTYRNQDALGQWHDISVSAVPAFDEQGVFIGYRGAGREVTALKNAERALQSSEVQLRTILEASPVGVALVSRAQRVVRTCNARMAELMGYPSAQDIINQPLHGSCLELMGHIEGRYDSDRQEMALSRADGTPWWAMVTTRVLDFRGEDALLVWVYDVSELHVARESVQRMAWHDPLTDLANRRYLQDYAQQALDRAQRLGSRGAVIYLDLDGFKAVNDLFGHQQGDALLVAIAVAISARLRRTDFLARIGGDEFALLVEAIPNDEDPLELGREIIALVGEIASTHLPVGAPAVGASAGVAYFGGQAIALDALLSRADAAMYRAKVGGRGQVCVE